MTKRRSVARQLGRAAMFSLVRGLASAVAAGLGAALLTGIGWWIHGG